MRKAAVIHLQQKRATINRHRPPIDQAVDYVQVSLDSKFLFRTDFEQNVVLAELVRQSRGEAEYEVEEL
jgi:hypothetical protein